MFPIVFLVSFIHWNLVPLASVWRMNSSPSDVSYARSILKFYNPKSTDSVAFCLSLRRWLMCFMVYRGGIYMDKTLDSACWLKTSKCPHMDLVVTRDPIIHCLPPLMVIYSYVRRCGILHNLKSFDPWHAYMTKLWIYRVLSNWYLWYQLFSVAGIPKLKLMNVKPLKELEPFLFYFSLLMSLKRWGPKKCSLTTALKSL